MNDSHTESKSNKKSKTTNAKAGRGKAVSTGMQALNLLLPDLGWQRSRLNAVTGPDQRVLREVLLRTVAAAQTRGEQCVWIQVGDPIGRDEAERAGVDLNRLRVRRVDDGSPAGVLDALIGSASGRRKPDLLLVDSLPAPGATGWQKAARSATALAEAVKGTRIACVYAMHLPNVGFRRPIPGADLGARYTRRLKEGTEVRIHLGHQQQGDRNRTVAVASVGDACPVGRRAILDVTASGRIKRARLSAETLIDLGFKTRVLTERRRGCAAFRDVDLGLVDDVAIAKLVSDPGLAGRLQRAIAKAVERDPHLLDTVEE